MKTEIHHYGIRKIKQMTDYTLAIVIPKDLAREAKLFSGDRIEFVVRQNEIILRKLED